MEREPPDLLASCDVQAAYAPTAALDAAAIEAAFRILSPDEKARAERFMFPNDRRDYIAAHALLRRALSERHALDPRDWRFAAGSGGKPELEAAQGHATRVSFNLSHTDGFVACAIGRGAEIGIDVEAIDRRTDVMALADRYFSPAERADLHARATGAAERRFIEIWTLKEAFVKATGAGVTRALDAFSFAVDEELCVAFDPPEGETAAAWRFAIFAPLDRYRMAVAVRAEAPNRQTIVAKRFEW
jgi:4'-phosphopantetheinyl transferase